MLRAFASRFVEPEDEGAESDPSQDEHASKTREASTPERRPSNAPSPQPLPPVRYDEGLADEVKQLRQDVKLQMEGMEEVRAQMTRILSLLSQRAPAAGVVSAASASSYSELRPVPKAGAKPTALSSAVSPSEAYLGLDAGVGAAPTPLGDDAAKERTQIL